jgi:DNA-directed RNA polymerase subunit RPC12/RpoP
LETTISFECKHCGASLEVPKDTTSVKCKYCGSDHLVSYHDGIVTAELTAKVERLERELARLKNEKKLPELRHKLELADRGFRLWDQVSPGTPPDGGERKNPREVLRTGQEARLLLIVGLGRENVELIDAVVDLRYALYRRRNRISIYLLIVLVLAFALGIVLSNWPLLTTSFVALSLLAGFIVYDWWRLATLMFDDDEYEKTYRALMVIRDAMSKRLDGFEKGEEAVPEKDAQ